MIRNKINRILITVIISVLLFSTVSTFTTSVAVKQKNIILLNRNVIFVEKSTGLNVPSKESGNTELELADINNDGNLDIICV